jgi:hypothetical protein
MDLDDGMLIHVKPIQIKLGFVRLEKTGNAVDHTRPDCSFNNGKFAKSNFHSIVTYILLVSGFSLFNFS